MTRPTLPGFPQQDLEGRSVRDVVAHSPGQVNDAWCRKILRKILQSLELQYAMQMPHRAITADTIVFHANGEPLLISDDIDAAPAPNAHQADDLTALACVIHYAITHELSPAGPLAGRVEGYSAALVATIDACMDPDPARRPQSFGAALGLLGIAAPGPLAGAVTLPEAPTRRDLSRAATIAAGAGAPSAPGPPASTTSLPHVAAPAAGAAASAPAFIPSPPEAVVEAHHPGTRRSRSWAIAAGGGAIALALSLVWSTGWRDAGSPDRAVLTASQTAGAAYQGQPGQGGAASVDAAATDKQMDQAATGVSGDVTGATASNVAGDPAAKPTGDRTDSLASGASSGGTTQSGGGAGQPDDATRAAPRASSAGESVAATEPPAVSARASVASHANRKPAADARAVAPPRAASRNASYQLQITPWGNVYVDGVSRGISPPLRRLALTPGPHTIRITNPEYRDSILEFESAQTTSNGKIIVEFDRDAQ